MRRAIMHPQAVNTEGREERDLLRMPGIDGSIGYSALPIRGRARYLFGVLLCLLYAMRATSLYHDDSECLRKGGKTWGYLIDSGVELTIHAGVSRAPTPYGDYEATKDSSGSASPPLSLAAFSAHQKCGSFLTGSA